MKVDVILGLQWGDEGKGKVVDALTPQYDIIARFQGGTNAGHTIEIKGDRYILHLIPSGIFHKDKMNVIGNGVIIDPFILQKEIASLQEKNFDVIRNLYISRKAHLILPSHRMLDAVYERSKGAGKVGSTLKGIGPTYTDKTARNGLRMGDIDHPTFHSRYQALRDLHFRIIRLYEGDVSDCLIDGLPFDDYEQGWFDALEKLKGFRFIDSEYFINKSLDNNLSVLAEGAQGTLLDVDFGTYPYVTSSHTVCAGVCSGLGLAPHRIGRVYGIVKAYTTRVGGGPFPTELKDEKGDHLREKGFEFGSTTGRPRRCGWLDLVALRYAVMLNGVSHLIMTKADVLSEMKQLNVCTAYSIDGRQVNDFPHTIVGETVEPIYDTLKGWNQDLCHLDHYDDAPQELKDYIRYIESNLGVPFIMVSVGAGRRQILTTGKGL